MRATSRKGLALGGNEMMALEDSLQAIAGLDPLLDESFPMGHQRA